MRHAFMQAIADALAARDIATLRWEFPYMAAGRARPDRPEVAEAAVRAVWTAARERLGELPMIAGGKSFGGRMTSRAHAAQPLEGLHGIAFLGFPLHPAGEPSTERAEHLAQAAGPLLFVQGTRDELAELRRLRRVVRALGPRATLHLIDDADHAFAVPKRTGRDSIAEVADAVAAWTTRKKTGPR
jgi:predicted alpha/beta-hydrolase family hydrolase